MFKAIIRFTLYVAIYTVCFHPLRDFLFLNLYVEAEWEPAGVATDKLTFCTLIFSFTLVELFIARKRKKARYNLYSHLVRDNVRQVDAIAAATGFSPRVVKRDLRKLVKKRKGDFREAYFNEATEKVVLTRAIAPRNNVPAQTAAPRNNVPAQTPAPRNSVPAQTAVSRNNVPTQTAVPRNNVPAQTAAPRNLVCPACGANVTLFGKGNECEYCGTRLQPRG